MPNYNLFQILQFYYFIFLVRELLEIFLSNYILKKLINLNIKRIKSIFINYKYITIHKIKD